MKHRLLVLLLLFVLAWGTRSRASDAGYALHGTVTTVIRSADPALLLDMYLEDLPVVVQGRLPVPDHRQDFRLVLLHLVPQEEKKYTSGRLGKRTAELLAYFTFPQLAFLYPRHGFW